MLLFKGHLSQHTHDFSAAFSYEKLASATAISVSLSLAGQCKATLDVADNNVRWIPFAQNAGTIEKAIAAKQTPQLYPVTEICISAPPNLTVFH